MGLLRLVEVPHLQRFEIETQRGDGRFQFVCHAVDKVCLPLIEANFFDGDHHIGGDPAQQDRETDCPDREPPPQLLPRQQHDVQNTIRSKLSTPRAPRST